MGDTSAAENTPMLRESESESGFQCWKLCGQLSCFGSVLVVVVGTIMWTLGTFEPVLQCIAKEFDNSGSQTEFVCPSDADWIVVGGGAAGCAAAAALTDAGLDVLVLERGPSDKDPAMEATTSAHFWPQSVNVGGEVIRWTDGVWGVVAKVLGGGTSLNGGLYIADSHDWFERAMPGVDYDKLMDSYEAVKRELGTPAQPTTFGRAWNKALSEAGYGAANLTSPKLVWTRNEPFVPYSTFNLTEPAAPRFGSAALLHARANRANLRVVTEALVEKIIFEGTQAVGVRITHGKGSRAHTCNLVRARKGIVLSAGAVFTPQLLQISGVGPKELVEDLGVNVVADLPAVGANFTDRLVITIAYLSPSSLDLTIGYVVRTDIDKHVTIEGVGGGEITTELATTSIAFVPPHKREPELRPLLKLLFAALPKEIKNYINRMIQPVALQTDTHSRGWVKAVSTDANTLPNVTANYFDDPRDWKSQQDRFDILLDLGKVAKDYTKNKTTINIDRELLEKFDPELVKAFGCLLNQENYTEDVKIALPCLPQYNDTESRDQYLRDYLVSSYHYFGSAAVGTVLDGVDFSVKGTSGLYVVDASTMPYPTNVNPQGTVMALGHYVGTRLAKRNFLGTVPDDSSPIGRVVGVLVGAGLVILVAALVVLANQHARPHTSTMGQM